MGEKNEFKLPEQPLVVAVERQFNAPADQVFDAWLDPVAAGHWLFKTPTGIMQRVEIEPRVGGHFVVAEQRGDVLAEHHGRFIELDRPRRIVFLFSISGFQDPNEILSRVTIDIRPIDGGCNLSLTHEIDPTWAEYEDRTRNGWNLILDGLAAQLATGAAPPVVVERILNRRTAIGKKMDTNHQTAITDREIVSSRVFDFSRDEVFRAFSDPAQVPYWWGPTGFTNTIEQYDLRPGGKWKLTMHGPDGTDYHNISEFIEVSPPERVVYLHLEPFHRFQMTMTFAEQQSRTNLTWRMLFESADHCAQVRPFIEPANEQNFDRLAAHLQSLNKT